jgi:4-carboxymuconolactone decarboxylase
MARIDPVPPAQMDARQKEVHDRIASGPRGRVRGPLAVWLHSPELADRAQNLGEYLRYAALAPRLSELAILVTARHWTAQYLWWVHEPIAVQRGLPQAVVESIRARRKPDFQDRDEETIWLFVTELLAAGPVSDATYARAAALLGVKGVVDLGAIVGYYTLGAFTMATALTELPDDAPAPLA